MWKTPFEMVYGRCPSLGHLWAYECLASAMTKEAQKKMNRRMKLKPRAWLGYLVGYSSTNIFKIWVPILKNVIRTRDVIFKEDEFYGGDLYKLPLKVREMDLVVQEQLRQKLDKLKADEDVYNQTDEEVQIWTDVRDGDDDRADGHIDDDRAEGAQRRRR
jgi:hypothetical protein